MLQNESLRFSREGHPADGESEIRARRTPEAQPMPYSTPSMPQVAELHIAGAQVPAIPVHLDGHEASIVVRPSPPTDEAGSLRLAWGDGRETELAVVVRTVGGAGPVAQMDVRGVSGDWQPFLEYVGRSKP